MLEIDGSYGEGGGQVVRTALALSSVFQQPFKMNNIRAGRSNPGLSHQHLGCVELMSELTDAEVEGGELGSQQITFVPQSHPEGEVEIDIGTAGSISLLFQCVLPTLPTSNEIRVTAVGGTDVKWSPPIDYLVNVTRPLYGLYGVEFEVDLVRRGYYPKGGGKATLKSGSTDLKPFKLTECTPSNIQGVSHCGGLPRHVAERQAESAMEELEELGLDVEIEVVEADVYGKGSGISLWTGEGCLAGGSALGEPGKPAEKVGREAGSKLKKVVEKAGALDKYAADQLAALLPLTGGSYTTVEVTSHTKTNVWLVNRYLEYTGEKKRVVIYEDKNCIKLV